MKTYDAKINGISHTFQLSDEDAKARGLDPEKDSVKDVKVEASPLDFAKPSTDGQQTEANVAADAAAAKAAQEAAQEADAKARAAANKSQTAANKAAAADAK